MSKSEKLILAISVIVVVALGATSAFFFIAMPLSPSTTAAQSSDGEDDEPDEDEVDEKPEPAPEFDLDDLAQLAYASAVRDFALDASGTTFEIAQTSGDVRLQWASANESDTCLPLYLATSLVGAADDESSAASGVNINGFAAGDFYTEGYYGSFGRVLDTESDALDLLSEFDAAGKSCRTGFAVERADGLLAVSSVTMGAPGYRVPEGVEARTITFTLAADSGLRGFRVNILQYGNALIETFVVVQSQSPFVETIGDELAEALAEALVDR
jgi:hypothetical protein